MTVKALAAVGAFLALGMNGVALAQSGRAGAQPAAAPATAQQPTEGVVAIVNDRAISTYDVRQRAYLLLVGSQLEPNAETMERAQAQALRELVDEQLQLQEASDRKIVVDRADVDRELNEIARRNGGNLQQLVQQLAAGGINVSTLRQQVEADIAWRRLVGGRYGSRVRVSDAQVNETMARIAANASKPQFLLSEIFFAADSEAELQQAASAAQRLMTEMKNRGVERTFPAVARQFSSSPTAVAGGDMGWLSQSELNSDIQAAVSQAEAGALVGPITTPSGVYLIAVREKRAGIDAAAASRVALMQVTAPSVSRAQLDRVRRRTNGCGGIEAALRSVPGGTVTDLGEESESELSNDVRARIDGVESGAASMLYETPQGLAFLAVCDRRSTGEGMPTRDEVERRLFDTELAMLAQRYLRNLRRDSTVIYR
jgi:peptidyl-prolyl cis-trans isomerase SurA